MPSVYSPQCMLTGARCKQTKDSIQKYPLRPLNVFPFKMQFSHALNTDLFKSFAEKECLSQNKLVGSYK